MNDKTESLFVPTTIPVSSSVLKSRSSFCPQSQQGSSLACHFSKTRHTSLLLHQRRKTTTKCTISAPVEPISLSKLDLHPYIDETGKIPYDDSGGKVGVYAIYNQQKRLAYVGKSRDVRNSLRMHLVRKPLECYWFSVQNVRVPSRVALNDIEEQWLEEWEGDDVQGNDGGLQQKLWENPVDVLGHGVELLDEEKEWLVDLDDRDRPKILKMICRRVQKDIEGILKERGVVEPLKFAPKLKSRGLLDVESQKIAVPDTL